MRERRQANRVDGRRVEWADRATPRETGRRRVTTPIDDLPEFDDGSTANAGMVPRRSCPHATGRRRAAWLRGWDAEQSLRVMLKKDLVDYVLADDRPLGLMP